MSGPWEDFAPAVESGPWEDFAPKTAPKPEQPQKPLRKSGMVSVVEPLLAMGTGMIAKPVSDVAGLARLGMEGLRRAGVSSIDEIDPETLRQGVQSALTYQPRTSVGQALTQYNPLALLGKGVDWLGVKAESLVAPPNTSGPGQAALGYGIHEAVNQLPMFAGLKAPAVAEAAASGLAGDSLLGARGMMTSALKPPLKEALLGNADKAVATLLDEGVNVSRGGMEKLRARIDLINDNIKDVIANSTATIDKSAVASRLQGAVDKFKKQVAPLSDVSAIQRVWDQFMSHPLLSGDKMPLRADQERPPIEKTIRKAAANQPGSPLANILEQVSGEVPGRFSDPRQIGVPPPAPTIPIQVAQEMKQGTYRSLGDKAYGELKGADIEAQKTLARALKEEIANAAPEVRPLNADESKLLNALSLVERRVLVSANKNPMGLSWLTTSPTHFAAFMADRSELFKSLIARMLSSGSKAIPEMNVAGPVMGAAVTEQADQHQ